MRQSRLPPPFLLSSNISALQGLANGQGGGLHASQLLPAHLAPRFAYPYPGVNIASYPLMAPQQQPQPQQQAAAPQYLQVCDISSLL